MLSRRSPSLTAPRKNESEESHFCGSLVTMLDAMLDQREMRFESAREKSFAGIVWPHANSQLTPARLAAAGFYAAATQKAPDRVVCGLRVMREPCCR